MSYNINLDDEWFELVKSGDKTYEVRINVDKHSLVEKGDNFCITNRLSGEKINGIVSSVEKFSCFEELFNNVDSEYVTPGYSNPTWQIYYKIEGYKKGAKLHGVVCIGLDYNPLE